MTKRNQQTSLVSQETSTRQLDFLFWNIGGSDLTKEICQLVYQEDTDILMVAELGADPVELADTLTKRTKRPFHYVKVLGAQGYHRHVALLSAIPGLVARATREGMTVYTVNCICGKPFLLAAAHLRSKLYQGEQDALLNAKSCADYIRDVETEEGHQRTVLVGDLNANPFEDSVVAAEAFHGVMDPDLVLRKRRRRVRGKRYFFFYNPSWRFCGTPDGQPHGTYFYSNSCSVCHFWNMFDQVLVRPALIDNFIDQSLAIVSNVRNASLLTSTGRPSKGKYSDHLPLRFSLEFTQEE